MWVQHPTCSGERYNFHFDTDFTNMELAASHPPSSSSLSLWMRIMSVLVAYNVLVRNYSVLHFISTILHTSIGDINVMEISLPRGYLPHHKAWPMERLIGLNPNHAFLMSQIIQLLCWIVTPKILPEPWAVD